MRSAVIAPFLLMFLFLGDVTGKMKTCFRLEHLVRNGYVNETIIRPKIDYIQHGAQMSARVICETRNTTLKLNGKLLSLEGRADAYAICHGNTWKCKNINDVLVDIDSLKCDTSL
ncbi:hypothetical protein CAEBREN_10433 [Caenorhabditis brenneri]|uniref:Uncharacterized protein n=1 Tax=Caenorhabditis brenneri TaxID=135651 RepID=G0NNB8_CAEBE|nr:hypothetical protein CAEBREN_10433 [Caenorhabditis brenneri]